MWLLLPYIKKGERLIENQEIIKLSDEICFIGDITDTEKTQLAASTYTITWQGQSSPSCSASVSYSNFNSNKKLYVSAVVKGSPVGGNKVNAKITVTPTNYKLKSGKSSCSVDVYDGNLGTYLVLDVTPTSTYNGKTVTASVSISSSVSGNHPTATGQMTQ